MSGDDHDHIATSLGRARMVMSMLCSPKLRRGLGELLTGEGASEDASIAGPLSRLDWIDADGTVEVGPLQESTEAIGLLRSPKAVLAVERLESLPETAEERTAISERIARLVFDRAGRDRALSEPELNAAITMFTPDAAMVRRDAVDSGVLSRTPDGAWYRLSEAH